MEINQPIKLLIENALSYNTSCEISISEDSSDSDYGVCIIGKILGKKIKADGNIYYYFYIEGEDRHDFIRYPISYMFVALAEHLNPLLIELLISIKEGRHDT